MGAVVRLSEVPRDSEEARSFLQARLALFGAAGGLLGILFFVLGNLIAMIDPRHSWSSWLSYPPNRFHLVATVVLGLLWVCCRSGARTSTQMAVLDAGALWLVSAAFAPIPAFVRDPMARPELEATMAVQLIVLLRSIVVPSSPGRTGWIAGIAALPPIAVAVGFHGASEVVARPVILQGLVAASWSLFGVIAAILASRTIFGLRRQVSEAMKLGQYTLEAEIGAGGMGRVYRARHAMLRRPTAIKLLPPEKAGAQALSRFEREVQLTSFLTHPNTIAIYDYGRTPDGVFYYAMEYVDGLTLFELVREEGALPPARAVHLLRQVCGALAEAHANGLVHRDIKPSNILVCERGGLGDVVKVVDFGLVRAMSTDPQLSDAALLVGTPQYMSPEAVTRPDAVDARSDLYALGAVAYWLLTASDVFHGDNVVEVLGHHLGTVPEAPSARLGRALPDGLDALVLACLEKKPDGRPHDASALDAALAAVPPDGWSAPAALQWWTGYRSRRSVQPIAPGRAPQTMTVDVRARAM